MHKLKMEIKVFLSASIHTNSSDSILSMCFKGKFNNKKLFIIISHLACERHACEHINKLIKLSGDL